MHSFLRLLIMFCGGRFAWGVCCCGGTSASFLVELRWDIPAALVDGRTLEEFVRFRVEGAPGDGRVVTWPLVLDADTVGRLLVIGSHGLTPWLDAEQIRV